MLGAIIGDIVGSVYEWHNYRHKDFPFFTPKCFMTDDSFMTLAVGKSILESHESGADLSALAVKNMQDIGRRYPGSYGGRFGVWLFKSDPKPYNSFGNGSAMRVSPCGFAASSLDEAKALSRAVTEVTHNHPEGLKGAEVTAALIYLARAGKSMAELKEFSEDYYKIDFTLDEIRDTYEFDESCQNTVPQALEAFFEAKDFEDAIRNAISIGGDSDTLAAITGGIAQAYFGIPAALREGALAYFTPELREILDRFEGLFVRP